MTNSDVKICNMALGHLGHNRQITSLEDATTEGRNCKLFYETAKNDVLQDHEWNFATKDEVLSQLDETVQGWAFLYARPPDCLYIRCVHSAGSGAESKEDYEEIQAPTTKQRAIASDAGGAYLRYTTEVKDPNLFTASFSLALSYKLATMLAQPITGNISLAGNMASFYDNLIERAKITNKTEKRKTTEATSCYLDAR